MQRCVVACGAVSSRRSLAVYTAGWGGMRACLLCTLACHLCGLVCVRVWLEAASILRWGCSKVGLPGSLTRISPRQQGT